MLVPLFLALLLFQQPPAKPQQPPPDSAKKTEKPADQAPVLQPVPKAPEDPTEAPTDADAPKKTPDPKGEQKTNQKSAAPKPAPARDPTSAPTDAQQPQEDITKPPSDITAPPIELEDKTPKIEYTLDPAKARKEFDVGKYHMRRSNWASAASRFEEATKWNPGYADAWLSLAEAREKKGELAKALEAYRKFLDLDPDAKRRKEAEKAMARVQHELKQ